MMSNFRKLVISLDGTERSALAELAQHERRDPRDQAALIIRADLVRRGLLPAEPQPAPPQKGATPLKGAAGGSMIETEMTSPVLPTEFAAVSALLIGFIRDLTPDPNSLVEIEVPVGILSALAVLTKSFKPRPYEGEADELAFILETLEGYLCQSHGPL